MNFSVERTNYASIRVIGVGGGGCNALSRMINSNAQGVDYIAVNTDAQALDRCDADTKIRIGEKITRGLGAGADPLVGAKSAEESREEISAAIEGSDMLFITAGMGGGTGTGAAPVIAQIARELGILTVGVVTRPFRFEGAKRMMNAEAGIRELEQYVDALIVVPNDKLLELSTDDTTLVDAFGMADQVLRYGVMGISDLVTIHGLINLDMADVKRVMTNVGICHLGIGRASGENRMDQAIDEALHSPLLETSIEGARKLIINFTGQGMKLKEVNHAASMVRDAASPEAEIIFGAVNDEDMQGEVMITLIATGFAEDTRNRNNNGKEVNFAASRQDNRFASQPASRMARQSVGSFEARTNTGSLPQSNMPDFLMNRSAMQDNRQQDNVSAFGNNRIRNNNANMQANPNMPLQRPNGNLQQNNQFGGQLNRPVLNNQANNQRAAQQNDKGAKILPWFYAEDEDVNE